MGRRVEGLHSGQEEDQALTYLDTQVVVWLYAGKKSRIPKKALQEIQQAANLLISPMVELELNYLRTRKGLAIHEGETIIDLSNRTGLRLCDLPFALVVAEALHIGWTEDHFDRIIVAQAAVTESRLITADAKILAHYKHAVWD
jgi:PIN domain nuclease of toxin-antitoxin system